MDMLLEIQKWYASHCDGDWEHQCGIEIATIDNPGWSVRINLANTDLQDREFNEIERLEPEDNWIKCWVEKNSFHGVGDPSKLSAILETFCRWAISGQ